MVPYGAIKRSALIDLLRGCTYVVRGDLWNRFLEARVSREEENPMTLRARWCVCLLPVLLLLLAPRPASAQFSGVIQGTITDGQKAVVVDAVVMVTNIQSGVTRESVTTSDGVFRILSLGPGAYRVEVIKPGFLNAVRESVTVGISDTVRLDFTLEVSGVQESVTVTTTAPLVETEQGRVSGRVDRLQLQEMPLSGRNLYNLIALQPGVTGKGVSASISGGGGADDSFAGESAPRINASGQRDEANNYTVDQTSTNGVARGGITNLTPNTESVEEVRVVSNNFSAVDGRSPGAQIQVITKSGTNQFRGSGSYYFQGDQLTAKNVFESSVPTFDKNQFGYSLGGPIVKNQLFFFTSYEGLRQTGARGSSFTVETPQFRNFILSTRPNSIAAQLLRNFAPAVDPTTDFRDLGSPAPGPNTIGPPDGILDVGSAFFVPEGWRRGNQFNVRGDYEVRPGKDRLYGNFYRTNSYAVTGGIRPPFNRPDAEHDSLRQRQLHAHVQQQYGERIPRRRHAPRRPPRHTPAPRDPWHHDHRRDRFRPVRISERLVADELGLQEHPDHRQVEPPPQGRRGAAADVRLGHEHEQLHPGVLVLEPSQLCRR